MPKGSFCASFAPSLVGGLGQAQRPLLPDSKAVTLVDFESIGQCTGEEARNLDAPELLAIFGRAARSESPAGG